MFVEAEGWRAPKGGDPQCRACFSFSRPKFQRSSRGISGFPSAGGTWSSLAISRSRGFTRWPQEPKSAKCCAIQRRGSKEGVSTEGRSTQERRTEVRCMEERSTGGDWGLRGPCPGQGNKSPLPWWGRGGKAEGEDGERGGEELILLPLSVRTCLTVTTFAGSLSVFPSGVITRRCEASVQPLPQSFHHSARNLFPGMRKQMRDHSVRFYLSVEPRYH